MTIWEKLDPYQREAVDWAWPLEGAGLFAEQGTGKTWITLGLFERMLASDTAFNGLIVAPVTSLISTWAKNLTAELPRLSIAYDWDAYKKLKPPRLFLAGFERSRTIVRRLKNHKWSIVVFDESQRLNKRSSGWSRMARMLRHTARRLALSGTPLEQKPIDVWAQMRFINHEVLGEDWLPFAHEYCRQGGFMGKEWKFIDRKLPQFLDAIRPYCLRISADVLNLPPHKVHKEVFDLFGNQAEMYQEMEDEMVTSIKGHKVIAPLKITSMIRTQQITGGFLTDDDNVVHKIGDAKIRRLRRLIESGRIKFPIVVFCRFTAEIAAVESQLKEYTDKVEVLSGNTGAGKNKAQVRADLNKRFQAGLIDALVCQTKTGGVSIDLYRAQYGVIYSTTFSYIDYDQVIKRFVRRGQTKGVSIFFLCARNTIDEDMFSALQDKRSVTEAVLTRLKRRA